MGRAMGGKGSANRLEGCGTMHVGPMRHTLMPYGESYRGKGMQPTGLMAVERCMLGPCGIN
eukprot:1161472-Pelagomonas_calceolata.AAC.5